MAIPLLWLQLAAATLVILGASTFLAKSADIIAFKTGLGRSFVGVVLLATATSLPELGTGVSSIVLVGEPDLAAGDAFGSNLVNLLIIGLIDIFWRGSPLLKNVGTTSVLTGALGVALISLAAIAILIHSATTAVSGWYVSPVSVAMFVVFLAAMYMIFRSSQAQEQDAPQHAPHEYGLASMSRATLTFLVAAAAVLGSAIWLAQVGDRIATAMAWEASYVGTQFLAISTSLPELATSFAAIRLNAPDLAISNLLGSNLFNMGFVLFLDDVAYSNGALWTTVSEIHSLTAVIAIVMTCVILIAMGSRPRERPGRFWTVEAALLIGLYLSASGLVFYLS